MTESGGWLACGNERWISLSSNRSLLKKRRKEEGVVNKIKIENVTNERKLTNRGE